jgi:enoyl-CoA hydratase/carnithine racemase
MEFLLSRRVMAADEAMATGLVTGVIADASFRQAAVSYVAGMLRGADPHALRVIKQQAWDAASQTLPHALITGGLETAQAIARPEFTTRLAARARSRA